MRVNSGLDGASAVAFRNIIRVAAGITDLFNYSERKTGR